MSSSGDRVAIQTDGFEGSRTFLREWTGTSWSGYGDSDTLYGPDFSLASFSDDGERVAFGTSTFLAVFEWNGSSYMPMGARIVGRDWRRFSMAGNGNGIAVRGESVHVYEWNNESSWRQLGDDIDDEEDSSKFPICSSYTDCSLISMSQTGDRVAVGGGNVDIPGTVRVFEWDGSSWAKLGDTIALQAWQNGCAPFVAMSSDGRRLAVGCNGARIFEFQQSSWTQIGAVIDGHEVSMSGNGDVVAVAKSNYVRVFSFVNEKKEAFPTDFNEVTCNYIACLNGLLKDYGSPPVAYGDDKLDRYTQISRTKVIVSEKKMKRHGNAFLSLDRLIRAMKWIEWIRHRGAKIGNDDAVAFANGVGDSASACAIDFVENFINAFMGEALLDDEFLLGKPTTKLREAQGKQGAKKWKKSIRKTLQAIQIMLNKLGENSVPRCND